MQLIIGMRPASKRVIHSGRLPDCALLFSSFSAHTSDLASFQLPCFPFLPVLFSYFMRIVRIVEKTAPISLQISNAYIDFSKMTCSVVAVVTDIVKEGKPGTAR